MLRSRYCISVCSLVFHLLLLILSWSAAFIPYFYHLFLHLILSCLHLTLKLLFFFFFNFMHQCNILHLCPLSFPLVTTKKPGQSWPGNGHQIVHLSLLRAFLPHSPIKPKVFAGTVDPTTSSLTGPHGALNTLSELYLMTFTLTIHTVRGVLSTDVTLRTLPTPSGLFR